MSILSFVRKHVFLASALALFVIFVAILLGRSAKKDNSEAVSATPKIELVKAATFRNNSSIVAANGVVQSSSQAELRSQLSAPVVSSNVSIGDSVVPGQIIMELSNADIRAQLAQAEAALSTAKGQRFVGTVSLESAKRALTDKIKDSYTKSYDVVNGQIYPLLYNNDGAGTHLDQYIVDRTLTESIRDRFIDLQSVLKMWKKAADPLSASSSVDQIASAESISQKGLADINTLLGLISQSLNDITKYAPPDLMTKVDAWKGIVVSAKASVSGNIQAETAANTAFETGLASQNTTAESGIDSAEAGVNNLRAQLAKTIVRSPISGKISSLPLRPGELATPGALLATVVGSSGTLEVKTYVSGEDLPRIKTGDQAVIGQNVNGIVSNVAPSVDPSTKKAEVRIEVKNSKDSNLVIGENVNVNISVANASNSASNTYMLPIQDVKIVPGQAFVYTLDSESKIKSNEVTLGRIQGDFVEVVSGITDDMEIVAPVYDLEIGQSVNAN